MIPELSVVVATYNRPEGILALLGDLDRQDGFAPGAYEVIVVDDGSKVPIGSLTSAERFSYPLRLVEQANAGPGAARHHGITLARGGIVVLLDDDMRVSPTFLTAHRDAHATGLEVVQGLIVPPAHQLPLFERWHARQLLVLAEEVRVDPTRLRGAHLATGNVSLRRERYMEIGGFDAALKRSEDRDLGIRFEKQGVPFGFSHEAAAVHHTDLAGIHIWLRRAVDYGVADTAIAAKHPDVEYVDPWRFLVTANALRAPLLLTAAVAPPLGRVLSHAALRCARIADRIGLSRVAFLGMGSVYALEYFRGVRAAAGSLPEALRGLRRYLVKRRSGRAAQRSVSADVRGATKIDLSVNSGGRAN